MMHTPRIPLDRADAFAAGAPVEPAPSLVPSPPPPLERVAGSRRAARALAWAAASWLVVAVAGQLIFAAYLLALYGRATVTDNFELWNKLMPRAYVPGALAGNLVVFLHVSLALVIMSGGALQLIPVVRRRWPRFHRWNGRIFLISVLVVSLGGLVMKATRGSGGASLPLLGVTGNALVIVGCAAMALLHARARRFPQHRRWALRLFLAASGVWFFRIGLMFWIVVNGGPVGFDPKTFRGPTIDVLSFAQYALPLLVLELTFRAQESRRPRVKAAMAFGLLTATLVTAAGVAAATMILWAPHF